MVYTATEVIASERQGHMRMRSIRVYVGSPTPECINDFPSVHVQHSADIHNRLR